MPSGKDKLVFTDQQVIRVILFILNYFIIAVSNKTIY